MVGAVIERRDTMAQNTTYVRWLAALAVLVSAGVHFRLYFDWAHTNNVVGPAFMLNAIGGLAIAVMLLAWRSWIPSFLAFGFGGSTIVAFILATTVGINGVHEKWVGGYVWAAFLAEAIALVTGAVLLLGDNPLRSRQLQHGTPVGRPHLN